MALGITAGIAALSVTRPAAADPLCSTLPNPVIVAGSGDVAVLAIAKALAPTGLTVVYDSIGSCLAVDAIVNGTLIGGAANPTAAYYDATGAELTCSLAAAGQPADVGISDVFAATCMPLPNGLPNNVEDVFGPVEAHTFAVPKSSTQQAISKSAGYFVYGFGGASGVAPWTDAAFIFHRELASGTLQTLAVGIGVPAAQWQGQTVTSSGAMVAALSQSTSPASTIGILTAEVAQANTDTVSILAFKDEGESCAYFPDSTQSARDKKNVRDGHYALWGPEHMFTQVDGQGQPLSANAKLFIGYVSGTLPPPGSIDVVALFAQVNVVPECAMHVSRTSELGPMASFAPMGSCGCYFDSLTTGTTTCTPCTVASTCPSTAPVCSHQYCETQ
jgi:hypothetical protein